MLVELTCNKVVEFKLVQVTIHFNVSSIVCKMVGTSVKGARTWQQCGYYGMLH